MTRAETIEAIYKALQETPIDRNTAIYIYDQFIAPLEATCELRWKQYQALGLEAFELGNARNAALARIAELEAALRRARVDMEGWGGYADDYFRDKWDIEGDLAAIDAALDAGLPTMDDVRGILSDAALAGTDKEDRG